jgi:hypothetical protein
MFVRIKITAALLLLSISLSSQLRWVNQYHDELNTPGHTMSVYYDEGFLITGWVGPNYPKYIWLIKTDVNGEVLWEKLIGDQYNSTVVDKFNVNKSGDIYLGGATIINGNADPLIVKLNSCGEKMWCRSFSTNSSNDGFVDIVSTPDDGCAALDIYPYFPYNTNRTGLLKFSSDGELLWQHYYQSVDPGIDNENLSNLILTPDNGFLMTGYCYYPDSNDLYWLHPYYIKTDSLGNFEWETVLHGETGDLGGKAWQTILNPSGTFYYSCINHYYHSNTLNARRPALAKMDLQGNVIGVYDLVHKDYDLGALFSAVFINDSLLAGSASWRYDEDEPKSRAVIFDTLGNIKDSLTLLNTNWLAKTAITHDGKLLFYNTIEENGDFDTYLFKLTQDLEQDTFYTRPFVYDSLCPYQIVSDTIVPDDCDVIVGIQDDGRTVGRYDGKNGGLEIWPNPAGEIVNCQLSNVNGRKKSSTFNLQPSISIYDIFGRSVLTPTTSPSPLVSPSPGQQDWRWQIYVTALPPGIYFLVVREERSVIGSGKFVIAR